MQVKLRRKKLSDGSESLYFDIYVNGHRHYEFLKLYLKKPKSQIDRDLNKQTMLQAETLCSKRQVEIQSSAHGYVPVSKKKMDYLDYFKSITEKRKLSGVDYSAWMSTEKHLINFIGTEKILISQIDEGWLERFKEYLLTGAKKSKTEIITQNSAHHYFNRIKHSFKIAYRDKIITENPADRVDYIVQQETKREFLTFEEVQKLAQHECRYPVLKSAFLFSVLTGLRWSDIQKLTWKEVQYSDATGWGIYFRQRKTEGVEYLPITQQAREILPQERGDANERVFHGLKYSAYHNAELVKWCVKAGITKRITFHNARHTNATLLLSQGVDIYTVSKLLGHSDIKTTEIYAKLIDEKKIVAVNKIPKLQF
jgi:integrase